MKFGLRDLFWLTLVAGLAIGWFCDHRWDERKAPWISVCPAVLTGNVLEVSNINSRLVEISLGSDDGLKAGNILYVTRGNQYIGQITIRSMGPDRGVGQIDPKTQRGKIQKGDNVSTKLS